ncbi:BTAD domain-containing putative transcriptional regulator [Mycobacterium camsae]|uniref:BTAD domain-containing putative transcriptional regulator n=1 Tax=Mycobacterium gordonae TaxID=1778 RepID=UPI00197D4805|nr:BTAD domain-containing putative transcriptional regulator [Mycobacterium gordonae]
MTVEFRLLGDVEVWVDGRRLEIGHARRLCVLVALLVDANHAVSPEQLVDRVWSDRPPRRARNSLAGYVSRLRSLLTDTDGVTISRGPSGYVLSVDASSVDLYRFRDLAARARASSDPVEAAALFDQALQVWSGEPFTFLDTPWVNEVRSAVRAERFAVELDRNDVALGAGRHGELLVELRASQAAHPLDERLAAQLMLAQYRCGRQADSLDTYRRTRLRLVEELGVEPSPALARVHQQILAGDARHRAEPAVTVDAVPVRPVVCERSHSELLRRATSFVGHERELAQTVAAVGEGPLVTLVGVGGVGKTRLAWEVARREQQRFVDGVWLCELGPLDNGEAVGHAVAAALRLRQQHGMGVEESVIEYLRSRTALVVLDNCEHVVEAAAGLAQRIVRQCPGVSVLATSRQPLGVEGEQMVAIAPLSVEDATRLFVDRARAGVPGFRAEGQPAGTVAEICRRVDCLPLGVELAAARMRVMSAADVVRRLDRLGFLRGVLRGALPRQQSLVATIDWSYRLLTEAEQVFFAQLSVFAGSFDLAAAHAMSGSGDEDETLDLLAGLVDKSMVVVRNLTDHTRYAVLETLRAYGRERLQDLGIENPLAVRHAEYFTDLAERAGAGVETAEERVWIERVLPDYDNLRTAFERAMAEQNIDLALRLIAACAEIFGIRVGYEVFRWAERVASVAAPEHPLYPAVVGTAARGAWARGEYGAARRLADLASGRVPGPGTSRIAYPGDVLADLDLHEGQVERVLRYWDEQVAVARRGGNPIRLGQTLSTGAVLHGVLGGDFDAYLPAAREGVDIAETTGNPTARSTAYFGLAFLLKRAEPARALALFDEAASLAGDVQNFWWYGIALMEAAATRAVHGDPTAAAHLFDDVLDHWDRVGDWTELWISLRYVTRLLLRLGAEDDVAFLHWAQVNAGKVSPLHADQLTALQASLGPIRFAAHRESAPDGAEVVARARSALQRHSQRAAAV